MTSRTLLVAAASGLWALCSLGGPAVAATSATDVTPADADRGSITLEPPPIQPRPRAAPQIRKENNLSGNPLWGIPLATLSVTRERPLFTPSRRAPAAPAFAAPRIEPMRQAAPPPAPPEHPQLVLLGTVIGGAESIGVFLDQAGQRLIRLKVGEGHLGWILRSVGAREATLAKSGQTEVLGFPPIDAQPPIAGRLIITR
jgi:general secretion pathway protein N